MQKDLKQIASAGITVVGISYDSVEILKKFSDKSQITFPLLSDSESKTIIAYAIKNAETTGKKFGRVDLDGVPYPGTYLVDQKGVVRAKLFLEGYRERHSVAELLKETEKLKK